MTTTISTKGQIVLPMAIRQRDEIEPGQLFQVDRLGRGRYLLKRVTRRPRKGLVALLQACPAKGWFAPMDRSETTDSIAASRGRR